MNKMKIFKKIAVMMMAMMLMVGVGILAGKPTDVYASQIVTSEITEPFSIGYTDNAGIYRTLSFSVKCTYTAVWDEGYSGYIAEAIFWEATNEYVGTTPVTMDKVYISSQTSGGNKYMDYMVNQIVVRVYVGVDEWGDVDLWVTRIS